MEDVQKLAQNNREIKNIVPRSTAIKTLEEINWDIPVGQISDDQYTEWNLKLDTRSCLGRAAASAFIVEKYFPGEKLMAAEVLKDGLVEIMLAIPVKDRTDDDLLEILTYEDPHMIITINGEQYDPISNEIKGLQHPVIKEFSTWKAIKVARAVTESKLIDDPQAKISFLRKLKEDCDLCLIDEHLIAAYSALGEFDKAEFMAKQILETRPTARLYSVLYLLTEEEKYKDHLTKFYGQNMFNVITQSI